MHLVNRLTLCPETVICVAEFLPHTQKFHAGRRVTQLEHSDEMSPWTNPKNLRSTGKENSTENRIYTSILYILVFGKSSLLRINQRYRYVWGYKQRNSCTGRGGLSHTQNLLMVY